jgi:hypothetical protein
MEHGLSARNQRSFKLRATELNYGLKARAPT